MRIKGHHVYLSQILIQPIIQVNFLTESPRQLYMSKHTIEIEKKKCITSSIQLVHSFKMF